MDENYRNLIETLATKLGTTTDHLWGVLVSQAPISGTIQLVLCIMIAAATAWWVVLVKHKTIPPQKTEQTPYPYAEWQGETASFSQFCAAVAVLITLAVIAGSADGIVSALINPEYWALKQLVN